MLERQAAACPHPARQRHRGQEAAAPRVSVDIDLALARHRQEVQPVPERRDVGAGHRLRIRPIEGGGQSHHRRGRDEVGAAFGAAMPGLEFVRVPSFPDRRIAFQIASKLPSFCAWTSPRSSTSVRVGMSFNRLRFDSVITTHSCGRAACRRCSDSAYCCASTGASPWKGSSSSTIRCPAMIARPSAAILPWPPDSAAPERGSIGSSSGTIDSVSRQAIDRPRTRSCRCTSQGKRRFSSTVKRREHAPAPPAHSRCRAAPGRAAGTASRSRPAAGPARRASA